MLVMFEDALKRFNRERYAPAQLVEYARRGGCREHWREMAELGWFELALAEQGRPALVPLLCLYRAAGEGLWREPIHGVFGEAALAASSADDPVLRQRLSEGLASGDAPLAFADRERGAQDHANTPNTSARRHGEGYILTGNKVAVIDDPGCAGYLVMARDLESGRAACYRVEPRAQGLEIDRYTTAEGRALADLHLDQVAAQFVCDREAMELVGHWGALLAAAECTGIMRGALQDTIDYLHQRRQFGRALIEFQALQHRLADMRMLLRETEALLDEIAENLDAGRPADPRSLLSLRAQTSRAVRHVTREAVQMHGGMGVTQECRVSHYYRRALTLDSLHGSEGWALEQLMTN